MDRDAPHAVVGTVPAPAAPGHGVGASLADAGSADHSGMYPSAGERYGQWLERTRPQLEEAMLAAVLPGEQQLKVFQGHVNTPGE